MEMKGTVNLTCLWSDSLLASSFSSLSFMSWREVASLWALRYLQTRPQQGREWTGFWKKGHLHVNYKEINLPKIINIQGKCTQSIYKI